MCQFWCKKKHCPINDAKVHNYCIHQNFQQGCVNLVLKTRRPKDKGPRYCQVASYNGVIVARIGG